MGNAIRPVLITDNYKFLRRSRPENILYADGGPLPSVLHPKELAFTSTGDRAAQQHATTRQRLQNCD